MTNESDIFALLYKKGEWKYFKDKNKCAYDVDKIQKLSESGITIEDMK